jgi:hypothetical protein
LSTILEVATIIVVLYFAIQVLNWIGVIAAVTALLVGRILGNAYMMYACHVVLSAVGMFRNASTAAPVIARASHPDVS